MIEPLEVNYDNARICVTVKTFQERRAHVVGSCTQRLSWFGSGCHMHIAQFVIATLATVLDPKIRLSHRRDRVTFCLQSLNTHIRESLNTDRRLFFSLPYFGFCTSISVLRFLHFSVFHLPFDSFCGVLTRVSLE